MHILLVDDDETLRESLLMLLTAEGYEVETAASGEEALIKGTEHSFDLILCDVRMPGMNGIEAITALKDVIADAHFIVMTGYASEDAPIQALRLGVDDYLNKPFDIATFLEKLRAIARRRRHSAAQAATSVWTLLDTLRAHFPELAERHAPLEESCSHKATEMNLEQTEREALQLAAWLHPLSKDLTSEETPPKETVFERLTSILIGTNDPLADLLNTTQEPTPTNPETTDKGLTVKTFGGLRVSVDGRPIERKDWQSAAARWLFIYLLSKGGQSVPEERLAEVFWPGSPTKKAHRSLVSSIHRARKALGEADYIARYDRSYGFQRDCSYTLDSAVFTEYYKQGTKLFYQQATNEASTALQSALDLYTGPYLPDCHQPWCQKQREDFKLKAVDAAEKLAQLHLQTDPAKAEDSCRKALELEPTSEPAWATLFEALAAQGRRSEVEAAYQQCVETLAERLGLKPGAKLRACYEECTE